MATATDVSTTATVGDQRPSKPKVALVFPMDREAAVRRPRYGPSKTPGKPRIGSRQKPAFVGPPPHPKDSQAGWWEPLDLSAMAGGTPGRALCQPWLREMVLPPSEREPLGCPAIGRFTTTGATPPQDRRGSSRSSPFLTPWRPVDALLEIDRC